MKVIIAGGRNIHELEIVENAVRESKFEAITEIVSGGAVGVDRAGEMYARKHNIPVRRFTPRWKEVEGKPDFQIGTNGFGKYWKLAGFKRNEEMANYADALIAVWDGKSRGTKHMITKAKKKGLKVYVHMV